MEGTETREGASTEALSHLEEVAGFTLEDVQHTEQKPCTRSGVVIHSDEAAELFNLLEANPREWNRRLRVTLSGWLLHLVKEGKIEGYLEATQKEKATPTR